MRITTSITWSMITGEVLNHEYHEYSGTVTLCKGQEVAQAQLSQQNALVQQQLTQQKAIQDQLQGAFGKYLSGDIGFSPEQMSVLQSQFMNQNTGAFNSAGANVRSALSARGAGNGDLPVGGDYTRGIAELEGAKASSQSQGLLGLRAQSLAQALSNQFNAGSLINGQAAQLGNNIGTFNNGASNALGSYITAVNAPGWMSGLAGIAGSAASGFASGFGQGLGKSAGKD
jgi:hypothetical protein